MGTAGAAFDVVGRYNQDQINGFSDEFLDEFVRAMKLETAHAVLDCMAGDGNLSARMLRYLKNRSAKIPKMSILEYSRVQCEFAKKELASQGVDVMWGDVLSMSTRDTNSAIKPGSFDRVVIKSANHEIPENNQEQMYQSVFDVLEEGGYFCNLGFLFDDAGESAEFREIARCKATLAGIPEEALNRHFPTRKELYSYLEKVGFVDIQSVAVFDYSIASEHVAKYYFSSNTDAFDIEFQLSQARARKLRKSGRIVFNLDQSMMRIPGEITVARKPVTHGGTVKIFNEYKYDYVKNIQAHRDMLAAAQMYIKEGSRVADLGCGIGLLAERLLSRGVDYLGMDLSVDFVKICKERCGDRPSFTFTEGNMNDFDLGQAEWNHVALINSLYVEGVEPIGVLNSVYDALRDGGTAIISGPISQQSFARALPQIKAQLLADGCYREEMFEQVVRANSSLLTPQANYYSVEGLIELLKQVGFKSFPHVSGNHYYGNAYLVVAQK